MKKIIFTAVMGLVMAGLFCDVCCSEQILVSKKMTEEPMIDGLDHDAAWQEAGVIVTHDPIAEKDVTIKSVYTEKKIFFLVTFPDETESRAHRAWHWNAADQRYDVGSEREDSFVFKWNMSRDRVDLSVYSDDIYEADIWFWKACRSDPAGYADDKRHVLSLEQGIEGKAMTTKSKAVRYLQRPPDAGSATEETQIFVEHQGDILARYSYHVPSESRADIQAKGVWDDGCWTIEFARSLDTGHEDDVQFSDQTVRYQFGISKYEIAGRDPDHTTDQPMFGAGDVSEVLFLEFQTE